MAYRGRLGLAMRRTSPRRFAPLATLCAATIASFVLDRSKLLPTTCLPEGVRGTTVW